MFIPLRTRCYARYTLMGGALALSFAMVGCGSDDSQAQVNNPDAAQDANATKTDGGGGGTVAQDAGATSDALVQHQEAGTPDGSSPTQDAQGPTQEAQAPVQDSQAPVQDVQTVTPDQSVGPVQDSGVPDVAEPQDASVVSNPDGGGSLDAAPSDGGGDAEVLTRCVAAFDRAECLSCAQANALLDTGCAALVQAQSPAAACAGFGDTPAPKGGGSGTALSQLCTKAWSCMTEKLCGYADQTAAACFYDSNASANPMAPPSANGLCAEDITYGLLEDDTVSPDSILAEVYDESLPAGMAAGILNCGYNRCQSKCFRCPNTPNSDY